MASGKHLVVVESPAKAQTIGRFLGPEYVVEASYGHVRDLPESPKEMPEKYRKRDWARYGVNLDEDFQPIYVVPSEKKKHVKRLKDALKDADSLLLATDEDREGESISWHVLQLLNPKKDLDVQRIVFHEVTPEAISQALSSPREVNESLVRAQEARRVLDRIFGYSLSELLWRRVAQGLSAGRVQSVAVRILVERERERIAFVSSDYWDLKAKLATDEGGFKARLIQVDGQRIAESKSFDAATGKLSDTRRAHLLGEEAQKLAKAAADAKPWTVSSLNVKPGSQKPAPPFITSTLQQEGVRKLRFTARRVMQVAQRLYEGIDLDGERVGLITYMRTDSVHLADRAIEQSRQVIGDIYGEDYLPESPVSYKTKAKRAQEAHEAIRPTDLSRRPQDIKRYLEDDELRLYELIWKRTIACQMVPARFERTAVEATIKADGRELVFAASGRRIVFPGFLRAYVEGSDDPEAQLGDQETLLPALAKDQVLNAESVDAEGHSTKPPYRYTEASLVRKLEDEGIGRPSTYASIIGVIQQRDYVLKRGNELIPTFTAFCVTDLLEKQFLDLVETHFTAQMENELDEVAAGQANWVKPLDDFYNGDDSQPGLRKRLEEGEVTYPAIPLGKDPKTDEEIVIKVGRWGPYVRRGEGGANNNASIPVETAPDELTLERALELLSHKDGDAPPLAEDPTTGRGVYLKEGRYGKYLELAQTEEEKEEKAKPRRVSIPRGLAVEDLTSEIAAQLIQLPRQLGTHPENGDEITTGLGRFGPFLKRADEYRNLESWQRACEITFDEALEILKQPKPTRRGRGAPKTVLHEIGEVEGVEGTVNVLDGRYGPYVTDGKVNATVPRGTDPKSITAEMAKTMLAEAAERKKNRKGGRKTASKAKTTKAKTTKAKTATKAKTTTKAKAKTTKAKTTTAKSTSKKTE